MYSITVFKFQEYYFDRLKKHDERKRASTKTPGSPERKQYKDKVKELRSKELPSTTVIDNNENSNQDREPDLMKCNIPFYDLKLFQEAQAIASEKIVSLILFVYYCPKFLIFLSFGKYLRKFCYRKRS